MTRQGDSIVLEKFIVRGDKGVLSTNCDVASIRSLFRNQFEVSNKIVIDFKGIRSISPSFAYECFAHIYDEKNKLEKILENLEVENDTLGFKNKVIKAIQRRIMVLS